jgi:hypothetical protein
MYPSSARLVPDDQSDERAFFARDLDEERDLSEQTVKRGHRTRRDAQAVDRHPHIKVACSVLRGGSDWDRPHAGLAILW